MNKRNMPTKEIPATAIPSTSFHVRIRQLDGTTNTTVGTATPTFDPQNNNLATAPLRRPNRLRPIDEDRK